MIYFSCSDSNRKKVVAGSQNHKPLVSLFRYVQLQNNFLVARNNIKKNRCIISEPVITAKWTYKLGACAECNKQIKSNWSTPCTFCTQAAFCSKLCARMSMVSLLCTISYTLMNFILSCYSLTTVIHLTCVPILVFAWEHLPL